MESSFGYTDPVKNAALQAGCDVGKFFVEESSSTALTARPYVMLKAGFWIFPILYPGRQLIVWLLKGWQCIGDWKMVF
jgi:hypothetical protein